MFDSEKTKTLLRMFQRVSIYDYFDNPDLADFKEYVRTGQKRQAMLAYAQVFPESPIVERYVAVMALESLGVEPI